MKKASPPGESDCSHHDGDCNGHHSGLIKGNSFPCFACPWNSSNYYQTSSFRRSFAQTMLADPSSAQENICWEFWVQEKMSHNWNWTIRGQNQTWNRTFRIPFKYMLQAKKKQTGTEPLGLHSNDASSGLALCAFNSKTLRMIGCVW